MNELTLTRTFDAQRDVVFKAWTDAKQLAKWWGPHHFTNPVCEIDPRKGGAIRIDMKGPAGTPFDRVFPSKGVIKEIVKPERIVFTIAALDDRGNTMLENLTTVTFEDQKGKTRVTVHVKVLKATPEAAQYVSGMKDGWTQSLERLEQLVGS